MSRNVNAEQCNFVQKVPPRSQPVAAVAAASRGRSTCSPMSQRRVPSHDATKPWRCANTPVWFANGNSASILISIPHPGPWLPSCRCN